MNDHLPATSRLRRALLGLSLVAGCASLAGCGGRVPPTRYYDLAVKSSPVASGGPVIVLEQLATDQAYDDERIVYRSSTYRLDYYDYHRWSAPFPA